MLRAENAFDEDSTGTWVAGPFFRDLGTANATKIDRELSGNGCGETWPARGSTRMRAAPARSDRCFET
jgi:hypothetical protein